MTKKLNVVFVLNTGKKFTFGLADPKEGLTRAAVDVFTKEAIDNKGFIVNDAYPVSVNSVYIHSEDNTPLE